MSDNPLAKIDTNALRDRVAAQVTNSFGMLIPEEQFSAMVEAQIKAFFETPTSLIFERNGYSDTYTIKGGQVTMFQMMVWNRVRPMVEVKLLEYMNEGEGKKALDGFLKDLFEAREFNEQQVMGVQRLMIAMTAGLFDQLGTQAVLNFKSSLANAANNAMMPQLADEIWRIPS